MYRLQLATFMFGCSLLLGARAQWHDASWAPNAIWGSVAVQIEEETSKHLSHQDVRLWDIWRALDERYKAAGLDQSWSDPQFRRRGGQEGAAKQSLATLLSAGGWLAVESGNIISYLEAEEYPETWSISSLLDAVDAPEEYFSWTPVRPFWGAQDLYWRPETNTIEVSWTQSIWGLEAGDEIYLAWPYQCPDGSTNYVTRWVREIASTNTAGEITSMRLRGYRLGMDPEDPNTILSSNQVFTVESSSANERYGWESELVSPLHAPAMSYGLATAREMLSRLRVQSTAISWTGTVFEAHGQSTNSWADAKAEAAASVTEEPSSSQPGGYIEGSFGEESTWTASYTLHVVRARHASATEIAGTVHLHTEDDGSWSRQTFPAGGESEEFGSSTPDWSLLDEAFLVEAGGPVFEQSPQDRIDALEATVEWGFSME